MRFLGIIFLLFFSYHSYGVDWQKVDWSENTQIPTGEDRSNIYQLDEEELEQVKREGYLHALKWPVSVTGLLIPYRPIKEMLASNTKNPLLRMIEKAANKKFGSKGMDGMYAWLGLNHYPNENERDIFRIPYPERTRPDYRMGVSLLENPHGVGMTFSCATCHSGTFLGKSIMGLTNKRARANEFFVLAKKYIPLINSQFFRMATKATRSETKMFQRTKDNIRFVGSVKPQVLGLDTSLPHVALSLSRRAEDDYATKDPRVARRPRPNVLETFVADSKPMPWWNLKYKTRWLSDGSIVAGNPVLTNFLWNEIGRGTDLHELEWWMQENEETIKELTAAAFATKAPHWTDFFPADSINLAKAKRGEEVFNQSCKKCHGRYEKAWSQENEEQLTLAEKLQTRKVYYHEKTPVKDVGTDPQRWMATKVFAQALNNLAISKWMKTTVIPQEGYVPPPLEGIFLRYPYMHNNSIPNLCALMQRPKDRPKFFVQGPSFKAAHYDADCVGYPTGANIPVDWWSEKEAIFDTSLPGLRNIGHSGAFYDKTGKSIMGEAEKRDLLEFLKTL